MYRGGHSNLPVLLFANKQDLDDVKPITDINQVFFNHHDTERSRKFHIQPISALNGYVILLHLSAIYLIIMLACIIRMNHRFSSSFSDGVAKGIDWLLRNLKSAK